MPRAQARYGHRRPEEELTKAKALTAEIERKLEQTRKARPPRRGEPTSGSASPAEADLVARAEAAAARRRPLRAQRSRSSARNVGAQGVPRRARQDARGAQGCRGFGQAAGRRPASQAGDGEAARAGTGGASERGATQDALNDLRARMAETNPAGRPRRRPRRSGLGRPRRRSSLGRPHRPAPGPSACKARCARKRRGALRCRMR